MKSDAELLADVQAELDWDPSFDNRGMVVGVKNGAVTLAGYAHSYVDKRAAEQAVKSVAGVRAVANEIEVKLKSGQLADKEIAEAALSALSSNVSVPRNVKAIVSDGWITLEGTAELHFQKNAAEEAVRNLWGVRGVSNNIELKPTVKTTDVKAKIQSAFQRHASLDANKVGIQVADGTVTLSGQVSSWAEREEAETAAWAAPGVVQVQNQLSVHA